MGVADVEANYAVVKAYQFTTLTSIQVRDKIALSFLTKVKTLSVPLYQDVLNSAPLSQVQQLYSCHIK